MSDRPLLLVEETGSTDGRSQEHNNQEIIAIAVYGKNMEVPLPVSTQRVFTGDNRFKFPTEITAGAAKTRVVYRYTIDQWRELLESTTRTSSPGGLKQLMIPLLLHMQKQFPDVFGNIDYDREFDPGDYAELIAMQ
ncbi:hypothetical protein [Desulfoscipio geothermicus]|uniref:Uncharacterized protein n=1 Tax=Desulfoscipio geothermicus DSM 3669 TaxID=1121426 RepID=A0A1I6D677_9FIRM|nr:hypothetical protein [Desulfoscipio geothermicus]SFR00903.1 hypothetical protein SAMN05660706_10620 [Desulfoscipio geothermicus DSM 3669]